ncbi:hypothetical protein M976_00827 [Buttiauxella ferragutiae ATCC 51602]|uniref:Uncharacterized protein n=1 Tax=Buttiauxella ferragutiae ATCC 51602 TaxID=1354252 RepID=A0ABX2WCG0_9ENTR|nr:hypothetical protein M976_00827 [Buttiauxella ferragutiae ATCC 51602]
MRCAKYSQSALGYVDSADCYEKNYLNDVKPITIQPVSLIFCGYLPRGL